MTAKYSLHKESLMKKSGFTLAELLITLGIIGVVSALTFSIATKLMPDKNKVLYLKVYDTIATTIGSLKNNSKLYPICSSENIDCSLHPLFSNRKPLVAPFNTSSDERFTGNAKLCNLLAYSFGSLDNANCRADRYVYDNSTFNDNISFVTQNGMHWLISPYEYSHSGTNANYQTDIWVDVNGSAEPNCIYADNCQKPDRFKFMIAANGTIVPADPMGVFYLKTRKTFINNANNDIENSEVQTNLTASLATFGYKKCNDNVEDDDSGEQISQETIDKLRACFNSSGSSDYAYVDGKATFCGLIFNTYEQKYDPTTKAVVVTLKYPATSTLTYKPIIDVGYGYNIRLGEISDPTCSIPIGEKSCSINEDLFFKAYIEKKSLTNPTVTEHMMIYNVPSMRGGGTSSQVAWLSEPYEKVVSPRMDTKYIYGGHNEWELLQYFRPNVDDYLK